MQRLSAFQELIFPRKLDQVVDFGVTLTAGVGGESLLQCSNLVGD
jgi:hypothetical protein